MVRCIFSCAAPLCGHVFCVCGVNTEGADLHDYSVEGRSRRQPRVTLDRVFKVWINVSYFECTQNVQYVNVFEVLGRMDTF